MSELVILPIDIATLALSRGIMQMMLGGLLLYLGTRHQDTRGARWWAAGFLFNGVSLFVFPIDLPPNWEAPRTALNHLSLAASSICFLSGFWRFGQRAGTPALLWLLLLIPLSSLLAWDWLWPNARLRVLCTASAQALFLLALQQTLRWPPRIELARIYRRLRYVVLFYLVVFVWSYASIANLLPTTARVDVGYHRALFSVASLLFMLALAFGCLALQFGLLAARNADLAMIDWLTGLLNRRGFFHAVGERGLRDTLHRGTACVLALDVDHFKRINDRHGHASGDRVLQCLAEQVRALSSPADIGARVGGEEFVLLAPDADLARGRALAETLRQRCAAAELRDEHGQPVGFTVSVGVALLSPGQPLEQALSQADEALYRAKRNGRNQTALAGDEPAHHPLPPLTTRPD